MYRSKKSGGLAASSATAPENSVGAVQEEIMPNNSRDFKIATGVMAFKARLMAPFMLYDRSIRQVVPNPAHDRVYRSEVTRVQGVVLRELRNALERETSTTPKEMLYGIQKSIMLAYASCAVSSDVEALVPVTSDEEAMDVMPRLESFFGERIASSKAVASLAAVLSTGIVRDSYKEACNRLEARLAVEEQPQAKKKRTTEGQFALEATKKNTQDLFQIRASLLTAFETISTPFNENGTTPLPNSATADATTAVLTVESYYSLLRWVLMMQPERLELNVAHSTMALYQEPQAAKKLFAKVTCYDPTTGKVVIERTTADSKWGMVLNASGALVGLENALRNATPAGGALYHALHQRKAGLSIFDINNVHIGGAEGEELEEGEHEVLVDAKTKAARVEKIKKVLQGSDCVISLRVEKVTTMGEPKEVAFDAIQQGGEEASGQQAVLILKRPSIEVQWKLKMRVHTEGVIVLEDCSDSLPVSEAARNFLSSHRGHLLLVQVNGCDATHGALLMDLFRSSLYLVLRLQVVDNVEQLVADAISKKQGEAIETVQGATVFHEERETNEDEEAEVAQHRALLEQHNIHPDEPLPEVNEFEDASLPKKKGRPKKLNEAEDAVAEMTLMEEQEEMSAAVTEAEEAPLPKKKGRPKKLNEAEDAVAEMTLMEEQEEMSAAVTEAEEAPLPKKKGRPKKLNEAEDAVAEMTLMEEQEEMSAAVTEAEEAPLPKKKGRPKKLNEAEDAVAEMTLMEEQEEMSAAVTEAEEAPLPKKKGRPKKLNEAEDAVAEMTLMEEQEEMSAAVTEAEEAPLPKKKGRPKKLNEAEDAVAEMTLMEEQEMSAAVTEAEEAPLPKKKGRPKKLNEAEDAVAEMTLMEEQEEMSAAVTEAEEAPLPKKKEKGQGEGKLGGSVSRKRKKLSKRILKEMKKRAREEKKKKLREMKKRRLIKEKDAMKAATVNKSSPLEEVAKEQGVLDTPVVNIKSHSELAAEEGKKKKSTKPVSSPPTKPSPPSAAVEEVRTVTSYAPTVSAVELKNAPPLTFENAVTLDRFDGSYMELRRPDLKTPWNMKVSFGGDKLVLTSLPPISAALKTHPFLKSLRPDTNGQINWLVDNVNGTDLTTANKSLRAKALDLMKKTNKISLLLRPLSK
ncbi:hypothetical protein, conserved [Trypanosoma cruzi]|uniref:Tripartite attachment complex protein 102 n=1 Tax=Trypanosoma cruzi (strain CL Brener) TaxID=353153 RepID=Q4DH64_TRYCC|nr:hypothetical protein, conserved [Trypanosoma cruzi]EAN91857.1 hypothetical protein, conserved [Trypanosoma cruzi]|eukprot:XP_813708.1 hypothetical protein [Trypanosoma cruzi strain CL Brener]